MRKEGRYAPMLNLKLMRIRKGFTLKQLAEAAHLNYNTINSWEIGKHTPSMENLKVIAKILGCELSELT